MFAPLPEGPLTEVQRRELCDHLADGLDLFQVEVRHYWTENVVIREALDILRHYADERRGR